jgi:bile acid-coenzyme A ligase
MRSPEEQAFVASVADPTSYVSQLSQFALERPEERVYWHIGPNGESPFSWSWLDDRSSQVAGALARRGLSFDDRLEIALHNSPELILSVFAAWKLGAVPVPVRWDLPDWERERVREVVEPRVTLSSKDVGWIEATASGPVPSFAPVISPHMQGICSSGSTGTPKIILSNHPACFNPAFSTPLAEAWAPVPRPQRILVLAPMYHVNAFSTVNNLLSGDHLFVMEKFDAARAVDAIERHRITTFTATPTMLQRMADLPGVDDRDLSSLVWITQGAAPMPPSLVHRWSGLIGAERIVMAYGMTEGIGVTAVRGDEWMEREGTVGKGMRGTEIRILDRDLRDLPPGQIGDVYLRSPSYGGSRYLGDAPQLKCTEDGFRNGGDLGYLDSEGFLYLIDRRVDLIITGGANVFPAEVEAALIDHPDIADVVVIGLKDSEWGRRVHVIVQPRDPVFPPGIDEVIAYAKGRVAAYKVPKTVEFVDAIPRSEATKVNRGRLVEERGG